MVRNDRLVVRRALRLDTFAVLEREFRRILHGLTAPMTAAPSICERMRSGLASEAAIDRGIDPRHREVALVVHGDLDHRRNVAHKAAMRRDTEPTLSDYLCSLEIVRR